MQPTRASSVPIGVHENEIDLAQGNVFSFSGDVTIETILNAVEGRMFIIKHTEGTLTLSSEIFDLGDFVLTDTVTTDYISCLVIGDKIKVVGYVKGY